METFIIKSRFSKLAFGTHVNVSKTSTTTTASQVRTTSTSPAAFLEQEMNASTTLPVPFAKLNTTVDYTVHSNDFLVDQNVSSLWNSTDFYNVTVNTSDYNDYEYQTLNSSDLSTVVDESWSLCHEWTPAQHNLFQTANLFLAAAFLIPGSFKQSVLLVRGLLSLGYMFMSLWGGFDICALDVFLWGALIMALNIGQTVMLAYRFLPPALTLELLELYLKVFKPLRVSKKHFRELVQEARVVNLECGDIYAVEEVSPADERLSILLKGKLRVTCDDTHLHFISAHEFVDSPEWEANHEQSDDVFQVSITAEENCVYLCWPRMKLERVLRHRPLLKTVLDSIIGKDITQKLYSLNEHMTGLSAARNKGQNEELWVRAHKKSVSMDAVNTGTTGRVRSDTFKATQRKQSLNSGVGSPAGLQAQCRWVPLVANQFPAHSPFIQHEQEAAAAAAATPATPLLLSENYSPQRTRSIRRNREVKFHSRVEQVS